MEGRLIHFILGLNNAVFDFLTKILKIEKPVRWAWRISF